MPDSWLSRIRSIDCTCHRCVKASAKQVQVESLPSVSVRLAYMRILNEIRAERGDEILTDDVGEKDE